MKFNKNKSNNINNLNQQRDTLEVYLRGSPRNMLNMKKKTKKHKNKGNSEMKSGIWIVSRILQATMRTTEQKIYPN